MTAKNKDDGGAAFGEFKQAGNCSVKTGGISVRDYFAAKALDSVLQASAMDGSELEDAVKSIASISYIIADAMLAERAK